MASESSKSALRGFGDRIDKADQGLHPLPEIRICQEGILALFGAIKKTGNVAFPVFLFL
jgi:hypothetical protein